MDLALSAAQQDLRARARSLTEAIMAHERACEENPLRVYCRLPAAYE